MNSNPTLETSSDDTTNNNEKIKQYASNMIENVIEDAVKFVSGTSWSFHCSEDCHRLKFENLKSDKRYICWSPESADIKPDIKYTMKNDNEKSINSLVEQCSGLSIDSHSETNGSALILTGSNKSAFKRYSNLPTIDVESNPTKPELPPRTFCQVKSIMNPMYTDTTNAPTTSSISQRNSLNNDDNKSIRSYHKCRIKKKRCRLTKLRKSLCRVFKSGKCENEESTVSIKNDAPSLLPIPPTTKECQKNIVVGETRNISDYKESIRSTCEVEPNCDNANEQSAVGFSENIEKVKLYGWYWGPISYTAAEKLLQNERAGSFIVRDSNDDRYIFSLTFKLDDSVRHVRIEHGQGEFSFGSGRENLFRSHTIAEFIENAVLHSMSGRYLFFLHRRPTQGPLRVQLLHPISRFRKIQTLQHMCRFVILKHVRRDLIDSLPLPKPLIEYLGSKNYFTEHML